MPSAAAECRKLSGNFTLSGEWSPCYMQPDHFGITELSLFQSFFNLKILSSLTFRFCLSVPMVAASKLFLFACVCNFVPLKLCRKHAMLQENSRHRKTLRVYGSGSGINTLEFSRWQHPAVGRGARFAVPSSIFLVWNVFVVLYLYQGGRPSPFDRNLGTKMAAKSAEKLIQQIQESDAGDGEFLHHHCIDRRNSWCSRVYHVLSGTLISGILRSRPLPCFRTEQGHCGACRRKWRLTDTDLCRPCDETQTMSHIAESYPLTKWNGGLSWLYSADEDAVSWLTSYGSWHAYEKKKKTEQIFNRCGPLSTAAVKFVFPDIEVSLWCSAVAPMFDMLPSHWNVTLMVNCLPHGHVALTLNVILSVDMLPFYWNVALTMLFGFPQISVASDSVPHLFCHTLNYDIGLLLLLPLIKKPFPEYVNHPQPCNHTHLMRLWHNFCFSHYMNCFNWKFLFLHCSTNKVSSSNIEFCQTVSKPKYQFCFLLAFLCGILYGKWNFRFNS